MSPLLALSSLLLALLPFQDLEFLRALERAQLARPAECSSKARIAPEGEPGTPLVIHGRAFAADGTTPLSGAIVFAYHTDRDGRYDKPGAPAHSWRLKGWAKTDADGRFEFTTIRPAPYPGRKVEAHVHLSLFPVDGKRYHAGGLLFADDPLVSEAEREATRKDPVFGSVRAVRRERGVEHVDLNLRIVLRERF